MKYAKAMVLTLSLCAAAAAFSGDAAACGGCFIQQGQSTQVSGHRMMLSIGTDATSLWDQIEYSGEPESFAWVLPIKGKVDIAVSTDELFQAIDQTTLLTIQSPQINCSGANGSGGGAFGGEGDGNGGGSDVTILDQKVVGPYETVQLAAQDPAALSDWLDAHGYNLPADVKPTVDAYVNDGFGFLALKLVPGKGVNSMKPVRVTTPGAAPVLPLRMVAAGTGVTTAIQLWVFSEGRYAPKNFPSFTIDGSEITWDWDAQSSDYDSLVQQRFNDNAGFAWNVDVSMPFYEYSVVDALESYALPSYADEDGLNAQENLDADLLALYGKLDPEARRVTHMYASLSRPALANDLELEASADQKDIYNYRTAAHEKGSSPSCGNGGSGAGSGGGGEGGDDGGGCSVPEGGRPGNLAIVVVAAGLAAAGGMARRRRRSRP